MGYTLVIFMNWCIHLIQYDTVEKAVKSALKKFGKIDILVNCRLLFFVYVHHCEHGVFPF